MALEVATRQEMGQRVAWLRKQADLNQRQAAAAIGVVDSGLFGRIENHGRSFDFDRIGKIADAFAGRGTLVDDSKELFDFVVFHGEVARVLRPHLRLVGEAQPESEPNVIERNGLPLPRSTGHLRVAA